VADEALKSGRSVYEIVLEKGYLSQAELDNILSPENMTKPRYLHKKHQGD
jgi:aspartate ammonia-lyase